MRWFRFYSEALDDPKVQRLSGDLFKSWVNLLCLANDSTPRGTLPSIEDIGFRLRTSPAKTVAILNQLKKAGLLDDDTDLGLIPHGWDARQSKSDNVAERVQKYRSRQGKLEECNVTDTVTRNVTEPTRNVTVTPQNRVDKNRVEAEKSREDEVARPRAVALDSPHGMCIVFLDAMGKTDTDVAPAWFDENRAHTKDMLEQGITPDKLRRYVAYEHSRGKDSLRLRYVKKDILDWEASGEPDGTKPRGSPKPDPNQRTRDNYQKNLAVAQRVGSQ